jgi:hypothetical protein
MRDKWQTYHNTKLSLDYNVKLIFTPTGSYWRFEETHPTSIMDLIVKDHFNNENIKYIGPMEKKETSDDK